MSSVSPRKTKISIYLIGQPQTLNQGLMPVLERGRVFADSVLCPYSSFHLDHSAIRKDFRLSTPPTYHQYRQSEIDEDYQEKRGERMLSFQEFLSTTLFYVSALLLTFLFGYKLHKYFHNFRVEMASREVQNMFFCLLPAPGSTVGAVGA